MLKTLKRRRRRVELNVTIEAGSGLGKIKVIAEGLIESSGVEVEVNKGETVLGGCSIRGEAVSWPDTVMNISIVVSD